MPYVPTKPTGKTLDLLVTVLAGIADVRALLGAADAAAAKGRIIPADGGFSIEKAGNWLGELIACAPPVIMIEAMEPEYEQVSEQTWRVRQQINLHLLHGKTAGDTPVDAYLRAWDQHDGVGAGLRAAVAARQIDLKGVFTVQAPIVFGEHAPQPLRETYLSALAVRILKGQP